MQHWWKWLLVPALAAGLALLMGSACPGIFSGRAEAAPSRGFSWPSWNPVSTKLVPIVSVGTPGLRLGMAQVSGPSSRVSRVRAVLQIDGDFNSVRAKIFVPSDSLTDLRRVQGTAVTGVVQYRLLDFTSHKATSPQRYGSQRYSRPSYDRPSYSRPSYSRPSYSRPHYSDDRYDCKHDNGHHYGQYKHAKSKKHSKSKCK